MTLSPRCRPIDLTAALCALTFACSEPAESNTMANGGGGGGGTSDETVNSGAANTNGGSAGLAGSNGSAGSGGSGGLATGGAAGGGPDRSAEIYDPTKLPRFDIELPAESVEALNQVSGPDDPLQDE